MMRQPTERITRGPLAGHRIGACPKCGKIVLVLREKGKAARAMRHKEGTTRDRFYAETTTVYGVKALLLTLRDGNIPARKDIR